MEYSSFFFEWKQGDTVFTNDLPIIFTCRGYFVDIFQNVTYIMNSDGLARGYGPIINLYSTRMVLTEKTILMHIE